MKRVLKYTVIIILLGMMCLVACFFTMDARRDVIVGNWSDPHITFTGVRTSHRPDHTQELIHFYYVLSQNAQLKYPRVVWENTAWENKITHRDHIIAKGYGVAMIKGGEVELVFVDGLITEVYWDNEFAVCKTKLGWISILGDQVKDLPSSFVAPVPTKNTLSERELNSPTSADKLSEIKREIFKANLGNPDEHNFHHHS